MENNKPRIESDIRKFRICRSVMQVANGLWIVYLTVADFFGAIKPDEIMKDLLSLAVGFYLFFIFNEKVRNKQAELERLEKR
ncbi:MAG: hypothetical protein PHQ23_15015 [Candidatus Wallbacteria bacterium]|nr:hypothetical protein [Candidatus Wallbacteria bacterium]